MKINLTFGINILVDREKDSADNEAEDDESSVVRGKSRLLGFRRNDESEDDE